ncbi:MAG: aliphatic sulfonate ABC transporter substrate-binding protein [Lachnospiraceae bacterium]|nr:aliphatic sulfonate ABC transporter substrate-binding protein [Lachnospiraceae bacterium]
MKTWRKWVLSGICILMLAGLVGCGKEQETEQMHIGYFNNVTHPQALLMKSKNTLQERVGDDVRVDWTAFNAGPAEVEALFAGDIDIGYIGPVPAISANVKSNGDVVVLSGATKGGAVLVTRKDSGIKSIKDLSNKTVAIPQIGNTQHLCLLALLRENDLKPVTAGGDITVSAVANADVANMMERGDIDAALVPEPWGATLQEQGAELLLDYDEIYMEGTYDVAVVVVRKEFMEENPGLVEAFLAEHEAATKKIEEEKDAALKTINAELQSATGKSLSDTIIAQAFERIKVSTELNEDSVMGFAQISREEDFIEDIPEKENLFTK